MELSRHSAPLPGVRTLPASLVAGVLFADAAAHLYWATGLTWPAADARALSLAVLNFEIPFTPRVLLPLIALLCTAGGAVLARSRGRGGRFTAFVTLAVAAGLLLRGTAGLVWALALDSATPFYWLNLFLYTPLCLAMAAVALPLSGVLRLPPHSTAEALASSDRPRRGWA